VLVPELRASGSPRASRNKGQGGVNKQYIQKKVMDVVQSLTLPY
jgi:hypothetical protein